MKTTTYLAAAVVALATGAPPALAQKTAKVWADPAATCAALATLTVSKTAIDIPSGDAKMDSATLIAAKSMGIAERGPTPTARIQPATPQHCQVIGRIAPLTADAPPIRFHINLPLEWNGRSVQYGGGGFNGVLITALGLPPASPFDRPSPLAKGYVTYGTDSGHETKQGEPPQAFALNDEAFVNFAHASYKKVRDVAVAVMAKAYGRGPENLYFVGSSEGGREGLTMAQRYPTDFDGIFSRVPVINWAGLQHHGTRAGLATFGEGYLKAAHVKLVHDAVVKTCDAVDGNADNLVSNPVACKTAFKAATLKCAAGANPDTCLNDAQIKAIETLHSPYKFPFKLANGLDDYPGFGVSGEAIPAAGPTGGWGAWWVGSTAPELPPKPTNGIAWVYGAGGTRYVFARDPNYDVTKYKPEDHKKRVLEVSALMDSTNPDLSAFRRHGGKLVILENMADYAQSPYAGIRYFAAVETRMGKSAVRSFARLYTAPGVDHVGSGAPGSVDMLDVLADWVEAGKAPGALTVVEQTVEAAPKVTRSRPLCEWPTWPKYKGTGDATLAASYDCAR